MRSRRVARGAGGDRPENEKRAGCAGKKQIEHGGFPIISSSAARTYRDNPDVGSSFPPWDDLVTPHTSPKSHAAIDFIKALSSRGQESKRENPEQGLSQFCKKRLPSIDGEKGRLTLERADCLERAATVKQAAQQTRRHWSQ